MVKTNLFLTIVALLVMEVSWGQEIDFSNYAISLSRITTFADNPGFMEEVDILESPNPVEWITEDEGYFYTEDLESIRLFAYKILYKSGDDFIVSVYYDSEGTATSSYLFRLKTTNTSLILEEIIGGGDRCHNTVILDEISVDENVISFPTLITPNKLMNWFPDIDNELYFDDCMVCCVGFAYFKYDIKEQLNTFESVRIIEEYLEEDSLMKLVYDAFVEERPLKLSLLLTEGELREFIKTVVGFDEENGN